MAYFQMDDGTDTELRVYKAGTAAFGLYARCGVWVARNLTDGFIPAEVAASYGTREWIDKLVASGLWTLEDGGFGMPDYLAKHDNKPADVVRQRRADAAARQAKMRQARKERQGRNMSHRESRVTNNVTHGVTHTTQSDPPPKGGEEGDAPLRGGGAPPSTTTTRDGHLICTTHPLQRMPCISCRADALIGEDNVDLDQRPPSPAAAKHPPVPAAKPDQPPVRQRIMTERAVAAGLLAGRPDIKRHLDAAVEQLLDAGAEVPAAEDIVALAADLATRPNREEPS